MDLKTVLRAQWDRSTAIACTALGALLLLVGWIGVSGTPYLAEQAPYILSGGVGGVFLLGVGATLWLSADLRDEWRKLDRIETALQEGTLRFVDPADDAVGLPAQREQEDDERGRPVLEATTSRTRALQEDVVETPVRSTRTRRSGSEAVAGTAKRSRAGAGHA